MDRRLLEGISVTGQICKKIPRSKEGSYGGNCSRLLVYLDVLIAGMVTKIFCPLPTVDICCGIGANFGQITAEDTRRVANKKGYSRNAVTSGLQINCW
jgi:hypothetical protein